MFIFVNISNIVFMYHDLSLTDQSITKSINYHSFPRALSLSTVTSLLIKFSPLRHQAHTKQLVHHTCTGPLCRELLHHVTQHICKIGIVRGLA